MERRIIVADLTAAVRALEALQAELGGRWATGVGNNYPEDYTTFHRHDRITVRRGDAGRHEYVATIIVDRAEAAALR